jgi:Rad3-related DNA helicase
VSIVDHFPQGLTPRPAQRDLLLQVEAEIDRHDVLCITAPPASGKTELAIACAAWLAATRGLTVNYMPPDNVLTQQAAARYPHLQTMLKQDLYHCDHYQQSCGVTRRRTKAYCKGCPYLAAKAAAARAAVRLMNTHVYRAHKLWAPVLIFDEAHKLVDMVEEMHHTRFWRHEYGFPDGLATVADVLEWGQEHLRDCPEDEKLRYALAAVARVRDGGLVEYRADLYRGEPDTLLEVRPATARAVPAWLWPRDRVQKIILMSATIGPKDIEDLGLAGRRVLYLNCESPIPAEQRPVIYKRVCNMAAGHMEYALPLLAAELRRLLDTEPGKGLIHLPYNVASKLRGLLSHPRLVFHDKADKAEALARFLASSPDSGTVLVASGLYEGLDLPHDLARWQVVGKVPYLSLGDAKVRERATADADWYAWRAVARLIQACGRIVRREDDFGVTYIFDSNFERLLRNNRHLFPQYFLKSLKV